MWKSISKVLDVKEDDSYTDALVRGVITGLAIVSIAEVSDNLVTIVSRKFSKKGGR